MLIARWLQTSVVQAVEKAATLAATLDILTACYGSALSGRVGVRFGSPPG